MLSRSNKGWFRILSLSIIFTTCKEHLWHGWIKELRCWLLIDHWYWTRLMWSKLSSWLSNRCYATTLQYSCQKDVATCYKIQLMILGVLVLSLRSAICNLARWRKFAKRLQMISSKVQETSLLQQPSSVQSEQKHNLACRVRRPIFNIILSMILAVNFCASSAKHALQRNQLSKRCWASRTVLKYKHWPALIVTIGGWT